MPIQHTLPTDKDVDRVIERVYRIDPKMAAATFRKIKDKFIEANPAMSDPANVPVGEPLVVPPSDDADPRTQPATGTGLLLRGVHALVQQLNDVAAQMLADMKSQRDDDSKTLKTLGKGVLKRMTAEDIEVAKPLLEARIKAVDLHIDGLTQSADLLKNDMNEVISRFST